MEGLAASVLLIAIFLGVLLVVGGLVYLLAQRPTTRSPAPPGKPVNRWLGIGAIVLVLLIIGLWAGIRSASNPQPQPASPLVCPTGTIWAPLQELCQQLSGGPARPWVRSRPFSREAPPTGEPASAPSSSHQPQSYPPPQRQPGTMNTAAAVAGQQAPAVAVTPAVPAMTVSACGSRTP